MTGKTRLVYYPWLTPFYLQYEHPMYVLAPLSPKHGGELIRDAAEELLDARRVADKSGGGF